MSMKRKRPDVPTQAENFPVTPSKVRRISHGSEPVPDLDNEIEAAQTVTTKRKRGRPPRSETNGTPGPSNGRDGTSATPAPAAESQAPSLGQSQEASRNLPRPSEPHSSNIGVTGNPSTPKKSTDPSTPRKASKLSQIAADGDLSKAADRSARRKSSQKLMQLDDSEDELDEDSALARRILNGSDSEGASDNEDDDDDEVDAGDDQVLQSIQDAAEEEAVDATPSKTRRRRKAAPRARTPTPPRNLPPYEHYFFQNRPRAAKTSSNTLASASIPSHEEYYNAMRRYKDRHAEELAYLHELHGRAFHQWAFELEEGYSVCLHGWGSKRKLLSSFAEHIHFMGNEPPPIVIVNGYDVSLTVRDIMNVVASTLAPLKGQKLGAQPADMLNTILATLEKSTSPKHIVVIIRSLDALPLRKSSTQALLARLAASSRVRFVASCDNPGFGLLWDSNLMTNFNFVFHDATTFQSFDQELANGNSAGGVVDEVLALLNRSGRRVHGKEGVIFVLRSLTESARRLFSLLVSEIMSLDVDDAAVAAAEQTVEDNDFEAAVSGKKTANPPQGIVGGIEYRTLYRKAVQQLITSNEISFGTLLKEFYDHQMVVSKRDGAGTEFLTVPFRKEECEAILEDLVMDA